MRWFLYFHNVMSIRNIANLLRVGWCVCVLNILHSRHDYWPKIPARNFNFSQKHWQNESDREAQYGGRGGWVRIVYSDTKCGESSFISYIFIHEHWACMVLSRRYIIIEVYKCINVLHWFGKDGNRQKKRRNVRIPLVENVTTVPIWHSIWFWCLFLRFFFFSAVDVVISFLFLLGFLTFWTWRVTSFGVTENICESCNMFN